MEAVVLTPESAEDLKIILIIAKKMRIKAKRLTLQQLEDVGLYSMMLESKKSGNVSRDTIMKTLKKS